MKLLSIVASLVVTYHLAAFVIYRIEADVEGSLIRSYPQALWYTLVTVSTVGYGDLYPVSAAGRLVASTLIIVSVGFIGYVIGKFGDLAVERNRRIFLGMEGTEFTGHYVIIGWNELSRIVIKEMLQAGFRVGVLSGDEREITEIRSVFPQTESIFVTFGLLQDDAAYERLNIREAAGAILLSGEDTATLITVLELRSVNPNLKITAYIKNSQLKKTVENAGVQYVISPNEVVGRMIASATFEPDVSSFLEDILSTTAGEEDLDIQEYQLTEGHELVGRAVAEASNDLEARTGARFLTFSRQSHGSWSVSKGVKEHDRLQPNDYLIVLANNTAAQKVSEYLGVRQGRQG